MDNPFYHFQIPNPLLHIISVIRMINSNTYPATQAPNNMQFVQAQPVPGYPQMNPVPMNGYPQPMPAVTMPPSPQIESK